MPRRAETIAVLGSRNRSTAKRKRGPLRRLLRRLLLLGVLGAIALVGLFALFVAFAPMPPDRLPAQTSYLYDIHGTRLAALSGGENRQVVSMETMSPWLPRAVLAAEDVRFYKHRGVDPVGILRALYQDVRTKGRRPQGGSTITQQYVKNVYVGRDVTLARKLKEAAISVKLEQKLTKDEILERYLNTVYFGRGAWGVEAASRAYFGVSSSKLDLAQAAYLAALLRGPESTDATRDPDVAARRRTSVLASMVNTGAITEAQRIEADAVALVGGASGVIPRKPAGRSIDYPEYATQWFVESVRAELVERFGEAGVATLGLRVTTTMDLEVQKTAYRSAYDEMLPSASKDPSAAVVVLDHEGHVRAMVGGRDWNVSKVNLATGRLGGGSGRPAGSTFKPFVLAAVLQAGYSLESSFDAPKALTFQLDGSGTGLADAPDTAAEATSTDVPATDAPQDSSVWRVRNFGDRSYGRINLVEATRLSVNTVFAQAVMNEAVGPGAVADAANLLGVETSLPNDQPSIALGSVEVSVMDMANAYLTLANRGVRTTPSFVIAVTTADGKALKVVKPERKRVMREADADQINAVLREVVRTGTGTAAAIPTARVAGKTGTTNNARDAWFVGYTPENCCVTAVWMGYPDGARAMESVHGVRVSGGTLPAKLFSMVMRKAVPASVASTRFAAASFDGAKALPGTEARSTETGAPKTTRSAPVVTDPPETVPAASETTLPASPPEPVAAAATVAASTSDVEPVPVADTVAAVSDATETASTSPTPVSAATVVSPG